MLGLLHGLRRGGGGGGWMRKLRALDALREDLIRSDAVCALASGGAVEEDGAAEEPDADEPDSEEAEASMLVIEKITQSFKAANGRPPTDKELEDILERLEANCAAADAAAAVAAAVGGEAEGRRLTNADIDLESCRFSIMLACFFSPPERPASEKA